MQHPFSRTTTKGSDVAFHVTANGSGTLNYHWLFNGNTITGTNNNAGDNNPTLILNNVDSQQEGTYSVRIDNQFGNTLSAGASLFVSSPPEIATPPIPTSANFGGNATFSVSATGNSPLSYQWRYNGVPITNALLSTLTLTNVQSGTLGNYDVIIRNPISSIISSPVALSAFQGVSFNTVIPSTNSGPFSFNYAGTVGLKVRIDGSTNLTDWTPLTTNVISTGSGTFSDSAAAALTNRYYRVVPLP